MSDIKLIYSFKNRTLSALPLLIIMSLFVGTSVFAQSKSDLSKDVDVLVAQVSTTVKRDRDLRTTVKRKVGVSESKQFDEHYVMPAPGLFVPLPDDPDFVYFEATAGNDLQALRSTYKKFYLHRDRVSLQLKMRAEFGLAKNLSSLDEAEKFLQDALDTSDRLELVVGEERENIPESFWPWQSEKKVRAESKRRLLSHVQTEIAYIRTSAKALQMEISNKRLTRQEGTEEQIYALNKAEIKKFTSQIREKVRRNWAWIGEKKTLEVEHQIHLSENGDILDIQKTGSSGDLSFDISVAQAILLAEPLPVPRDETLFKENFQLIVLRFSLDALVR